MTGHPFSAAIPQWLSPGRFEPYLRAAGHDVGIACDLYEWSARVSSAAFEVTQYFEVVMRNAMDGALAHHRQETTTGRPWYLTTICPDQGTQQRIDKDVAEVRARLRREDPAKDVRGQVIAGFSFGFWTNLLGRRHEGLWRSALRLAFPGSSGARKDVATALESLRRFRNRLAHHDSILAVDVPFFLRQMLTVLNWIDPAAALWLAGTERVTAELATRPISRRDTVVVAARNAWPLYQQVRAYVCQAGRTFQSVDRLAFYAEGAIQAEVPAIRDRIDNVDWSPAGENHLRSTGKPRDLEVANVIAASRTQGWDKGRYQVFLLTGPHDPQHFTLRSHLPHLTSGKGSGFTQRQRYVVLDSLRTASSTADL